MVRFESFRKGNKAMNTKEIKEEKSEAACGGCCSAGDAEKR
jgi:hypothetical protein